MKLAKIASCWRGHCGASWRCSRSPSDSSWKSSKPLLLLALLVAMATPVCFAAEPAATGDPAGHPTSPAAAASSDEEESFDEQLRDFGYWSGVALSCVPESKALETERQVLAIYQRIVQLFGTDRGFFYAAALGRGTSITMDPAKCPEFLEKFEKAAAAQRALKPGR